MIDLTFVNYFLYGTLGACGLGISSIIYRDFRNKVDKLANNELRDFKELNSIMGNDGFNISKNVRLKEKRDFEGICLIGTTGSYKTSTLFMNNLLENKVRGSYIITDPKGEIFEKTSSYQKNICGRKVYKIDFINTDYSEKYNLLEACETTEDILQLSNNLLVNGALSIELITGKKTGGVEWLQMAEPLLSALLLYTKGLNKPFNTIEFSLNLLTTLNSEVLDKLILGSNNLDSITQYNIYKQVGGADRTEGSIKITLSTNTKLFSDKNVNKINGDTTFDIKKFRKEESILYIIYPERKSSYLAPFIAPFYSQMIDKLLDSYTTESLPINLMFDEFGNIGMLSNMSVNASTVRSRKISLSICLQSISQLYQVYGEKNSKSILNNLKTKLILSGNSDTDTLTYISSLCGNTEINSKNISVVKGNQNYSINKVKRKVFEDGEIRTLKDKTILIISDNKMPVVDEIEPYFENDRINNVNDPIIYPKSKNVNCNILNEIERLKVINSKEVEFLNEEGGEGSKAETITRRIFT